MSGTLGGIVGIWLNNLLQVKHSEMMKKQKIYSKLKNLEFFLSSIYYYRTWYHIDFLFWQSSVRFHNKETQLLAYKEMKESQHMGLDCELKKANKLAELCEILGSIKMTFPDDVILKDKINTCSHLISISVGEPHDCTTLDELHEWKIKKAAEIQSYVNKNIKKPIDSLSDYLHNMMAEKKKRKFCFFK